MPFQQSSEGMSGNAPKATRTKRPQVAKACKACQRRRSKCDGKRPSCARCVQNGTQCAWEFKEGVSNIAGLKQHGESLERKLEQQHVRWTQLQSAKNELLELFEKYPRCGAIFRYLTFVNPRDPVEVVGKLKDALHMCGIDSGPQTPSNVEYCVKMARRLPSIAAQMKEAAQTENNSTLIPVSTVPPPEMSTLRYDTAQFRQWSA